MSSIADGRNRRSAALLVIVCEAQWLFLIGGGRGASIGGGR
jgi:hypothetical protein